MPTPTIFWSWQSDTAQRETRSLIRDALSAALDRIAADMEEADRPELDHDTRGVAGSPDIVATILDKIEAAAVFVADVTPIAVSTGGKHLANPNVLIELGYAKRALGTGRVVLVWNTALTGAVPENLPFDMRHRRAPLAYALAEGAGRDELRRARADLSRRLEEAVRLSLSTVPREEPPGPTWMPADEGTPSIWAGSGQPLVVNRGHLDGTSDMLMDGAPRGYARLVPSTWKPDPEALSRLGSASGHPIPLGRSGSLDWGPTRGGFVVYRTSARIEEEGVTPTATRWFRDNGEFWGVASSFFGEHDGGRYLATGYAVERWIDWLARSADLCARLGGGAPFHVELGLDGLEGAMWPERGWGPDLRTRAIEDGMHHAALLADASEGAVVALVRDAFDQVTAAFGLPPFGDEAFDALRRGR